MPKILSKKFSSFFLACLAFICSPGAALFAGWQPIGPYGGHALKIVMDPSNSQKLFVTTKNGQLYHSSDGGKRWELLRCSLGGGASLNTVVINPKNSNVMYIAVADRAEVPAAEVSGGILKSENRGRDWTLLQPTKTWSTLSLAIFPQNPDIVLAGALDGVYRTEDAGQRWKKISPPNHPEIKNIVSLAVDPHDPQVIYAGTPHLPWKTQNGGATWTSIHQGMINDSDVFSICVDGWNPSQIYLSACSGIYRSTSRGDQWIKMQGIPSTNRRTHVIVQDPVHSKTLYAGTTQGLWKSEDGGLTWQKPNSYPYVINSIAIDPDNHDTLYVATDRSGILKSLDGGKSFQEVNQGFVNRHITQFLGQERLYASSVYEGDFGGIFSSQDGGHSWKLVATQAALKGKNVISLAVSPLNSNVLFAGTYEGLLKSEDGGQNWQMVTSATKGSNLGLLSNDKTKLPSKKKRTLNVSGDKVPEVKIYDLKFGKALPNALYAATAVGLFESLDGGVIWRRNSSLGESSAVYKIVLCWSDPSWIMAQTSLGLNMSSDKGRSWFKINFGVGEIKIHDFAISPRIPEKLFAGTSHGLYQSFDGGKTWKSGVGGLPMIPIHQICFPSQNSSEVYLRSNQENQIYQSLDGGESWTRFDSQGLEGLTVQTLSAASTDSRGLFVLTENRGIYWHRGKAVAAKEKRSSD